MKRFISICRALTYASGVIPECFSRESAVAKRRYSVTLRTAKSHGMTSALGGRTAPGFTLIELLVVVLIIGILASVALPDYQRATEISRVGAALSFSRAFRDSVDRYYMQNGRFPSSPDTLDIGLTKCPKYFSCSYHELTTQGKFQMDRQNGPFAYGIITRSAVSPALPNTIYCYALRSNKKGVEFCEHWGEDATPGDGTWFRTLIQ